MNRAVRYIVASQICLYGGLLVCALLRPEGLRYNAGVSYFGTLEATIIPYTVALGGAGFFGVLAARAVGDWGDGWLRFGLLAQAWLIIGVLLTPYSVGRWVDYLHTTFGTLVFSVQLLLTGWLALQLKSRWAYGLWLLQLAAGIVSAYYVAPDYGHLTESQLAFQLIFGILVIYELRKLLAQPGQTAPVKAKQKSLADKQLNE